MGQALSERADNPAKRSRELEQSGLREFSIPEGRDKFFNRCVLGLEASHRGLPGFRSYHAECPANSRFARPLRVRLHRNSAFTGRKRRKKKAHRVGGDPCLGRSARAGPALVCTRSDEQSVVRRTAYFRLFRTRRERSCPYSGNV